MKKVQRLGFPFWVLMLVASPAAAFVGIDTLPWPSRGAFPAYPREDDRPTDLWVQAGIQHDNNALRSETDRRSDTIMRFGAGVRHDQRVLGRQRLRLEGRGDFYNYNRFNNLDHFAYSALGDWLWEIGNQLSGELLVGRERRQTDIGETLADRLDTVTLTRAAATAGYLVTPNLRLRGGAAVSRSDRSTLRETETRAGTITAGVDYVTPLANAVGIEYRATNGEVPISEFVPSLGRFVDNDYRERELALTATYVLGAQLRTGLRLGRTTRDYTELANRDFHGGTGRLSVEWLPGTKTILGLEVYREPRSVTDIAASHVLVRGFAFGPRWAATNKLVLSGRVVRERRLYEGDPALTAGAPLRDETLNVFRFALGWEPQRFWQIGLGLDRGERESNFAGRDYHFTAVSANLAWAW